MIPRRTWRVGKCRGQHPCTSVEGAERMEGPEGQNWLYQEKEARSAAALVGWVVHLQPGFFQMPCAGAEKRGLINILLAKLMSLEVRL